MQLSLRGWSIATSRTRAPKPMPVAHPWPWLMWMCVLAWCSLQSPVWAPAEPHAPQPTTTPVYLGDTQEDHKRHRQALPPLPSPLTLDPALMLTTQDNQSLSRYTRIRDRQAQEAFQARIDANPESVIAQNARRYLDAIEDRASKQRLLQLQGVVSFQHDDNVILAPDDDIFEFSNQADERTVFSFMGRLLPVPTPPWRLGAEYSLCQSLHFELSDFDLRTHTTRIFSRFKLQRTTLSMAADYTFTRRAKERFAATFTVDPSVSVQPTDNLLTVASVRYRRSNFFNQFIPEEQEDVRDRDGWGVRAGFDQYLMFNQQRTHTRLSYYYEVSRNAGSDWEYDSHQVGMGLHTPLPWGLELDAEVSYRRRNYLHVNSFDAGEPGILEPDIDTHKRLDHHLTASLLLTRKLGPHLQLSAGFVHSSNASTIDFFDYHRNIWTLALTGKY